MCRSLASPGRLKLGLEKTEHNAPHPCNLHRPVRSVKDFPGSNGRRCERQSRRSLLPPTVAFLCSAAVSLSGAEQKLRPKRKAAGTNIAGLQLLNRTNIRYERCSIVSGELEYEERYMVRTAQNHLLS